MVKLYHTTRNQKSKNIYNYSHYVKIGLQQIDQDSRTHHETKTRLSEEIFTSSKSGNQSRDSIPGSRDWHFSIPKSRDWKRGPGLQSLLSIGHGLRKFFSRSDYLPLQFSVSRNLTAKAVAIDPNQSLRS